MPFHQSYQSTYAEAETLKLRLRIGLEQLFVRVLDCFQHPPFLHPAVSSAWSVRGVLVATILQETFGPLLFSQAEMQESRSQFLQPRARKFPSLPASLGPFAKSLPIPKSLETTVFFTKLLGVERWKGERGQKRVLDMLSDCR